MSGRVWRFYLGAGALATGSLAVTFAADMAVVKVSLDLPSAG